MFHVLKRLLALVGTMSFHVFKPCKLVKAMFFHVELFVVVGSVLFQMLPKLCVLIGILVLHVLTKLCLINGTVTCPVLELFVLKGLLLFHVLWVPVLIHLLEGKVFSVLTGDLLFQKADISFEDGVYLSHEPCICKSSLGISESPTG